MPMRVVERSFTASIGVGCRQGGTLSTARRGEAALMFAPTTEDHANVSRIHQLGRQARRQ